MARDHPVDALSSLLSPFISMRCPAVESSNSENQVAVPQMRPAAIHG